MKYSKEQDIQAIISSLTRGKPARYRLVKRLNKKYGWKAMHLILTAFTEYDKKHKQTQICDGTYVDGD